MKRPPLLKPRRAFGWKTVSLSLTLLLAGVAAVTFLPLLKTRRQIWTEFWGQPPPPTLTLVRASRSVEPFAGDWAVFFEIIPTASYLRLQEGGREIDPALVDMPPAPDWFLPGTTTSRLRTIDHSNKTARLYLFIDSVSPAGNPAWLLAMPGVGE